MNKYHARKTNGYDSKREAMRAHDLRLMESAGDIHRLQEQVSFVLIPAQAGERACVYEADFVYRDAEGALVVEDVKSPATKTPAYRIKRKLMLFVHGIRIQEV